MQYIYVEREGKQAPAQQLALDIYEQIDIKQDGLIDIYEWSKTFQIDTVTGRDDFMAGH